MMSRNERRCPSAPAGADGVDRDSVYLIRIRGHLDTGWAEWFEGFTVTPEDSGETVMCAQVDDQAALFDVLRKIRDLGMPLVSVQSVQQGYCAGSKESGEGVKTSTR